MLGAVNSLLESCLSFPLCRLAEALAKLADCFHKPVLYISKNKTVNCNMQARFGQAVLKIVFHPGNKETALFDMLEKIIVQNTFIRKSLIYYLLHLTAGR